uniref:Uncharacterized protein n=1 Tax=Phasianus colchicus TaxID=9054 RepID=A0A669PVN1_PHACC
MHTVRSCSKASKSTRSLHKGFCVTPLNSGASLQRGPQCCRQPHQRSGKEDRIRSGADLLLGQVVGRGALGAEPAQVGQRDVDEVLEQPALLQGAPHGRQTPHGRPRRLAAPLLPLQHAGGSQGSRSIHSSASERPGRRGGGDGGGSGGQGRKEGGREGRRRLAPPRSPLLSGQLPRIGTQRAEPAPRQRPSRADGGDSARGRGRPLRLSIPASAVPASAPASASPCLPRQFPPQPLAALSPPHGPSGPRRYAGTRTSAQTSPAVGTPRDGERGDAGPGPVRPVGCAAAGGRVVPLRSGSGGSLCPQMPSCHRNRNGAERGVRTVLSVFGTVPRSPLVIPGASAEAVVKPEALELCSSG